MYKVFRNSLGQVDAVNRDDGTSLPYNPQAKTFDEENELTIELRQWEKENGELDLSEIPPEPIPEPISYRINKLLPIDRNYPLDRFPGDIDYNTNLVLGLTTKTIDYFGLRVAQIFYQSIDTESFEKIEPIPIVFEHYLYEWDKELAVPTDRIKKIFFYLDNGELSTNYKILPKNFYSASDKSDITYYRRQTILNWLIARASEIGLKLYVEKFFADYKDEVDKYVLYGDRKIIAILQESSEPWLSIDTKTPMGTIRDSIVGAFSKALEPTSNEEITIFLKKIELLLNSND